MLNARTLLLILLPFCALAVLLAPAHVASRDVVRMDREVGTFHGLAFLPDGKSVLIGDTQGYLAIWNLDPPRVRVELAKGDYRGSAPRSSATLAVTPDGRRAFVMGPTSLNVWDLETNALVQKLPGGGLSGFALSPDGKWVVCPDKEPAIQLRDAHSDKVVWRIPLILGAPPRFSADSRLLIVLDPHWRSHQVVEVATGRLLGCYRPDGPNFWRTMFSPSGRYAYAHHCASLSGTEVRVWEVATSREVEAFTMNRMAIIDMAFLPDGRLLTAGYTRGEEGREFQDSQSELLFWDAATGKVRKRVNGSQFFGSGAKFALSPDGRRALVGVDRRVSLWDLETGTGSWVIKPGK